MPTANVNNITVNYEISGPEDGTWLVLVNGLADDLQSWGAQVPAFTKAGYRVLSYDNRGIGKTSRPKGPYTSELLATDLHSLLQHLEIKSFHLLGVSMGGMIAQSYALNFPNDSPEAGSCKLLSLSLCCTYARPTAFCERMFKLWEEMAQRMSVQDVMRDVTLWAFTVPFFWTRTKELEEVETAMKELDLETEPYLSQLNVIQKFSSHPTLEALGKADIPIGGLEGSAILVLAGEEDILIPVSLSKEIHECVPNSVWKTTKGGHGCMVSIHIERRAPWITLSADCNDSGNFLTSSTPRCSNFSKSRNRSRQQNKKARSIISCYTVHCCLDRNTLRHSCSLIKKTRLLTTSPHPSASRR